MSGFSADREDARFETGDGNATTPGASSKVGMLFQAGCCLAMAAGFALIALSAAPGEPVTTTLLTAAPLAGCLAMHIGMHRFLKKKCHNPNPARKPKT